MTRRKVSSPAIEPPQVAALQDIIGRATAIHSRAEDVVHACADDQREATAWLARAGRDVVVTYRLCCRELARLRLDADLAALREESVHLIDGHRHVVDQMLKARFGVAAGVTTHDMNIAWDELGASAARLRALAQGLDAQPAMLSSTRPTLRPIVQRGL